MPEQQLVEIACALGAGARIVIMDEPTAALAVREVRKVGRNEPCPCGSGRKYKHCHGALDDGQ